MCAHGFPAYSYAVKKRKILQSGESAGSPARYQATPSNRILVVDDDRDLRLLSAEVLVRSGYKVDTAEDGEAGWEALHANSYDLLITDHNMPKVSGVELVKKVRSAHMILPVILASAALPAEELDRVPWLYPVATLIKPFSSDYLRICVRSKWLLKPFSSSDLLDTVNEVMAQPTVIEAVPGPTGP
jgi:CheY-like chemotaxis protein